MAEKHESKASEQAMHENDAHTRKVNSHDAVPGDDTAHSHSHAAHLGEGNKANPNEEGGAKLGERREPVMDQVRRHDEGQKR